MSYFNKGRLLRSTLVASLLMSLAAGFAPAKADDWDDHRGGRWREHERREEAWRRHHEWERHWDHRYWSPERRVYVYDPPPPVYYEPAPPPGVSFMFGFHDH
jgi:hypothetical protein